MKRIATSNRGVDMFGAGKDGFSASAPGVSTPTNVSAQWCNAIQEAIVRVVEMAGLAPSDDFDQFKSALNALFVNNAGLALPIGAAAVGAADGRTVQDNLNAPVSTDIAKLSKAGPIFTEYANT